MWRVVHKAMNSPRNYYFKTHYRCLLLQSVLAKIRQGDTASEVAKSVDLLMAIRWVACVGQCKF